MKLMRMNGQKKGKRRRGIILLKATGMPNARRADDEQNRDQRDWIGYQDTDIHHIPFPYPWALKSHSGEEFLHKGLRELAQRY